MLGSLTAELRSNIQQRGKQALALLEALKAELNGPITKVQGTGLLFSCELTKQFKGYGAGSTEEWMREHGIGVIHGGENSLRFTPQFAINEAELKPVSYTHLDVYKRQTLIHSPFEFFISLVFAAVSQL